jgi:hypothetical protein
LKKMKKILVSSVIAFCAMASQASYLAWQVGSGITADADGSSEPLSYNNANIYAVNDSSGEKTPLTSYLQNGTVAGTDIAAPMSAPLYADISGYSGDGYSYYIELSNYSQGGNNSYVASTVTPVSYTELTGSMTTSLPTAGSLANISVWHGGSYTAAPEPTSAILMLFGAAMLGLKRKNRSQC